MKTMGVAKFLIGVFALLLCASNAMAVNDGILQKGKPAKRLSDYGLFSDLAQMHPAKGVMPYALATPLFSDYTFKARFVYSPAPLKWNDSEVFEFPVGAVLVKTFSVPRDSGLHHIETRLLIKGEKGWKAWPYLWNDEQTDAVLKVSGARVSTVVYDEDGEAIEISHRVPNANQCKSCHSLNDAIVPIGPKARNLNYDFEYASGRKNQLAMWHEAGLIADMSDDFSELADWEAGSLEQRARAYLDVNCAHCHRRGAGASNSGLFLTYHEAEPAAWGYKKRPVAAGRGSGGLAHDIAPGDAENSIMVFRMLSNDPAVMMPELGRSIVHKEGVELISEWINSLE